MVNNLFSILGIGVILSLSSSFCEAQTFEKAFENRKIYSSRGYLILLPTNEWIFQPADSTVLIFDALTSQSFCVGDAGRTHGPNSLESLPSKIGTEISVKFYKEELKDFVEDTIYYFYCQLKTYRDFESTVSKSYRIKDCVVKVLYDNRLYHLYCYFFLNELVEIEPYDSKVKRELIEYMQRNDYALPSWFK